MTSKTISTRNQIDDYNWGTIGVHDPTIIKDRNSRGYYMFSTDTVVNETYTSGVQIRKSKDKVHWEFLGTALDGVPEEAKKWSNAVGLWAPEVIDTGELYRMYYSASTFGSTTSCIGLAEATSLEGPWEHKGIVVKTSPEISKNNAIDANIVKDKYNQQWLCYGSFFDGIYLLKMDEETGLPEEPNSLGFPIARRPRSVDTAIEGPYLIYKPEFDYYYLFSSYDSLNGTYNIRVSRSKDIEGPYIDMRGNSLLDMNLNPHSNGVKLLGSYKFAGDIGWYAPGHNSVFTEKNTQYMVHHVRTIEEPKVSYGFIRKIEWLENAWPVVLPEYINTTNNKEDKKI